MAVMVNPMGGGSDYRGPIYVKEFQTANATPGEFLEVVRLQGPGRLIQAIGARSTNGSNYIETTDNIMIKITPDGDDARALKKSWISDGCSSTSHVPVSALMASMSFPELTYSTYTVVIPSHESFSYPQVKADRIAPVGNTWHGAPSSAPSIKYSFPGNAEGISDSTVDKTLTIYQDGMFFDDSLVVTGRWGRHSAYSFDGVILVYQLFE